MPRQPYGHKPQIKLLEDGAIQNERVERYALLLADDIHRATAWKVLGGKVEGGSAAYRLQLEKDPLFQQRLKALMDEKETLLADDLYGEAKWKANQMWREGRATGNTTMVMKAFEAQMKIMEREDARRAATAPQTGVQPQNRPGKPPTENPQTYTGMDAIKQKLLEAGAPVPGVAASQPVEKIDMPLPVAASADPLPDPQPPVDSAPYVDFQTQLERLLPG